MSEREGGAPGPRDPKRQEQESPPGEPGSKGDAPEQEFEQTLDLGIRPSRAGDSPRAPGSGEGGEEEHTRVLEGDPTGSDPEATLQLPRDGAQSGEASGSFPLSPPAPGVGSGAIDALLDGESLEGQVVGNYRVLKKLGEGGMGFVLKAHDQHLNRFVALKLLHPHLARDQSFVKRFKIEAEAIAKLEHPNVVKIYSIGWAGRTIYFAMQFIRGYGVDQLLREQGSLSPRGLVELILPVAEGLAYTHSYGILHRDLKPGNIMVDETTGQAIVTDFGLASMDAELLQRRIDPDGTISVGLPSEDSKVLLGTPYYMAPELLAPDVYQGEPVQVDVYAVGVMMYQLLTGVLPFQGKNVSDILRSVLHDDPPPLQQCMDSDPPPDLVRCVRKAIARDPADRYPSMERLLQDLHEVKRQWEEAREVERKKELSREMASALVSAGLLDRGSSRVSRVILLMVVVVAVCLGLWGLWAIIDQDTTVVEQGPSPELSRLNSAETDREWTVDGMARVFGLVTVLEDLDPELVILQLGEYHGEYPRLAEFTIARSDWDSIQPSDRPRLGGDALLVGQVVEKSVDGQEARLRIEDQGVKVIPVHPARCWAFEGGSKQSVDAFTDDHLDREVGVAGTICSLERGEDAGGLEYLEVILTRPGADGPEWVVVVLSPPLPRAGARDLRIGDELTLARGILVALDPPEIEVFEEFTRHTRVEPVH